MISLSMLNCLGRWLASFIGGIGPGRHVSRTWRNVWKCLRWQGFCEEPITGLNSCSTLFTLNCFCFPVSWFPKNWSNVTTKQTQSKFFQLIWRNLLFLIANFVSQIPTIFYNFFFLIFYFFRIFFYPMYRRLLTNRFPLLIIVIIFGREVEHDFTAADCKKKILRGTITEYAHYYYYIVTS